MFDAQGQHALRPRELSESLALSQHEPEVNAPARGAAFKRQRRAPLSAGAQELS